MAGPFRHPRRALPRLLLGLALAGAARPRRVGAHALIVASSPPAGATLGALPERVRLRFNSRIDHGRSRLLLIGPDQAQIPLEPNPAGEPATLEAALPPGLPAAPGAWRLRWQVLALDGHITRGDIPFTLDPAR
ncbi:copper resistance CopC family protein [Crenalkalicoccus roseus]|uniref:copper resistance CopC family protein n=1 Tax=Crenalkalicoccus roseus TaxID=1485588 RepID=UPI001959559A|nr:copper resistance CopC family protein [Crenalkalicoccus roseus]